MMPASERFRPSWRGLQPGDPWTFITANPFRQGAAGPLIEALAREAARRDHAAATGQAASLKAQTHARGDLRSILNRPAE